MCFTGFDFGEKPLIIDWENFEAVQQDQETTDPTEEETAGSNTTSKLPHPQHHFNFRNAKNEVTIHKKTSNFKFQTILNLN